MGFFNNLFNGKQKQQEKLVADYFKMINGYTPSFTSFEGSVYEMDLTRSVIHSIATHISKLNIEVKGSANTNLANRLKTKANDVMDTSKFLYRLATILQVTNNVIIIPTYDEVSEKINGYYPIIAEDAKVVEYGNDMYITFYFMNKKRAMLLSEVGILNQFQFRDELFGDDNKPLRSTLNLLHRQDEGIVEAIKNGASIRFMAQLSNVLRDETLDEERQRFAKQNLSENDTGVMLFDSKYKEVKQVTSQPFTIDDKQMQHIKDSVYAHFGVNDKILQNNFNSQEWASFYEGKIEPFAIQTSLVLTNMTFTEREQSHENMVMLTANRLQYLSPQEKLATVTQLFDRGFLTHNQGREIYNMAPVENGDKYYIRKEYSETQKLDSDVIEHNNLEEGGTDEQNTAEET
ncbi:phage portal protein [Helcococcus kunzii]|uniref:phage portal protein n=1 Tax=Helcococcus kunzii TaxID=40091 RepID=UPI00389C929C